MTQHKLCTTFMDMNSQPNKWASTLDVDITAAVKNLADKEMDVHCTFGPCEPMYTDVLDQEAVDVKQEGQFRDVVGTLNYFISCMHFDLACSEQILSCCIPA